MSAIAAFLSFSEAPPPEHVAERMLAAMARRGPDGMASWTQGRVSLGHAALHTTPEAVHEQQPLAAGPFTLVADARLDDRDALLPVLHATVRELGLDGPVVTDAALLLAAHARWGADAPTHLVGDFAYAVWDARDGRLFAARDPMGVRQVFVRHVPGQYVALATEPGALLALPGLTPGLDEMRIAEALTGRLYDPVHSLFEGIEKLPAAHRLDASPAGVAQIRYWTLTLPPPPGGDAAEQFAALFTEAVRCRSRTAQGLGAELSGGLDSSAVTVVAAETARATEQPLHTFSAGFSDASGSDERVFIDAVLERVADVAVPHVFYPERERFVSLHEDLFARVDDGRVNGNHHFNYLSAREAHRAGVRVLLTGQDGDTTVGHGWQWFSEQTLAGDAWEAMRHEADQCVARLVAERDAYAGQIGYSAPGQIVSAYAVPVFKHWARQKRLVRLARGLRGVHRTFGASYQRLGSLLWRDVLAPPAVARARLAARGEAFARTSLPTTLHPDLVARTHLAERLARHETERLATEQTQFSTAEAQLRMLTSQYLDGSFEKLDRYAAAWGVEARHPFMDVRLIEFCLSLRSGEKLRDGFSRSVMRRALAERLPDAITWRANKAHLGAPHEAFVFESEPERVRDLVDHPGPAEAYLNPTAVRALWERRNALNEWELVWLTNALALTVWLKTR